MADKLFKKKRIRSISAFITSECSPQGVHMMALSVGQLPRNNPCAQCRTPIANPSWTEADNNRIHFIWHCHACNYRFQCTAIYNQEVEQIAA
jgi:hypothetical protein